VARAASKRLRPRWHLGSRSTFLAPFFVLLAGCSGHHPAKTDYEYVDPQVGWRIKTVTPILKSGGYIVKTVPLAGDATNLKTDDDFVGYEISYYSVVSRKDGVFVKFSSSETVKSGKSLRQSGPLLPLFELPPDMKYIRLLFLIKVSKADHNQGILAALSLPQLAELTRRVEANPEEGCVNNAEMFCSWVPAGVVAQLEKKDPLHKNEWIPTW